MPQNPTNPIEFFKANRRQQMHAATAAQRTAQAQLLAKLTARVRAEAGDLTDHVTITLEKETPPTLRIACKDHIPITAAEAADGSIAYSVRRGPGIATFSHLVDALIHGEPLAAVRAKKRPPQEALAGDQFDTTPTKEPHGLENKAQ